MGLHDPQREEVFEIKTDVSDPTGLSDKKGLQMGANLANTAAAHPKFRHRDVISTTDLHILEDGQTKHLCLHTFCTRCGNHNKIESDRKEIRWEPGEDGGRLSIAPFTCTWPGCGLRIEVKNNQAIEC